MYLHIEIYIKRVLDSKPIIVIKTINTNSFILQKKKPITSIKIINDIN